MLAVRWSLPGPCDADGALWVVILDEEYVMGLGWRLFEMSLGWRLTGMYGLCMSFVSGFDLRYVLYVLMRSLADYEFSSRWRLLSMVTLTSSTIEWWRRWIKRRVTEELQVGPRGTGCVLFSCRGSQSCKRLAKRRFLFTGAFSFMFFRVGYFVFIT